MTTVVTETLPLGQVLDITSGFAFESQYFNQVQDGLPLIRCRDVNTGLADLYYSGKFDRKYVVKKGDLLVSMDGDFRVVRWQHDDALLNQRVCRLEPHVGRLHPDYLYYFLPKELDRIHAKTPFATVKHLSAKAIREIQIPLPPLSEQKRIAEILDKADAIRRKRQEAIALADKLSTSAFLEVFGDPAVNPFGLPQKPLGKVADVLGGFAFKSSWFQQQGTKVVRIGDISDGFVTTKDAVAIDNDEHRVSGAYRARAGDILMALSGATTGKTGIVLPRDDGVFVNQRIAIIRAQSHQLQSFLRILLLDQRLLKRLLGTAGGSAQENLSPRILSATEIGIPSENALSRFHAIRQSLTSLRTDELERSSQQADELFNSLAQRAFKGKL